MRHTNFIVALWICACSVVLTVGQSKETLKVLAVVDEQSRPRLAKRLEEFIAYNRSKEWDRLFKLLAKQNARDKTLESFAKEMDRFGAQSFVPERATAEEPVGREYRIYGCLTRANRAVKGGVVAYLQEDDWFFTTYFLSFDVDGTTQIPCIPKGK